MTTWTNMKVNKQVTFSCNALRTHVTASSIYGSDTKSVVELKSKVHDLNIHPVLRKIFRDMLNYWESNK